MLKFGLVVLVLMGLLIGPGWADALGDVQYTAPEGWAIEKHEAGVVMAPAGENAAAVLVLYAPVSLAEGQTFAAWFDAELTGSITPPAKVLQATPVEVGERRGLDSLTSLRGVQDADGAGRLQMCHALSDGARAVLVMGILTDEKAIETYGDVIATFLGSLDLTGRTPVAPANPGATPAVGTGEPLPEAKLVNGTPQGLFVGVSVLSGNPAAMLFLDGGRCYHGIPRTDLNAVDWNQLQADSASRCSQWEMQGNVLRIIWPENIWESAVEPTATGFRFNGKSYGATHPVDMAHLAGSWEGTKSTAWLNMGGGGPATTQINTVQVDADGSYTWGAATGADVEGAVAYGEEAFSGSVEIDGCEAVFHARDGQARRLSLVRWQDPNVLMLGGGFYFRK